MNYEAKMIGCMGIMVSVVIMAASVLAIGAALSAHDTPKEEKQDTYKEERISPALMKANIYNRKTGIICSKVRKHGLRKQFNDYVALDLKHSCPFTDEELLEIAQRRFKLAKDFEHRFL